MASWSCVIRSMPATAVTMCNDRKWGDFRVKPREADRKAVEAEEGPGAGERIYCTALRPLTSNVHEFHHRNLLGNFDPSMGLI
jgi:hypothetical protein